MLSLPTPYGDVPVFTAEPEGDGPCPAIVVLHDANGMSTDVQSHARWAAESGYLAAAPDLYRGGPKVRCMVRLTRDLMKGREDASMSAIEAARGWLLAHPRCTGKVGVIGFCMGGGFALMLAPRGLYDAAAPNYGGLTDEVRAALPHACPIVASYGAKDKTLRGEAARMEALLTEAGVPHDVQEYPEAGHGFMNHHPPGELPRFFRLLGAISGTAYNEAARDDARARILRFFGAHLG
ncbi:MAG: dienelactone hydrolase family protein [Alphaproteobacteria bacterium]|nr:dienelactone hydrolase family protein [Alphaproteobacteria bacterium]